MTVLHQRQKGHARLQGGALYWFDVLDGAEVVGAKSVKIDKKTNPWTETATYALRDDPAGRTFDNAADFLHAYEAAKLARQRDDEWDAAAPATKEQTNG